MENLNAEQVKKALECCHSSSEADCKDCGYRQKAEGVETCINVLIADALALINSQEQRIGELEAENERLRAENKQLVNDNAELKNQVQEEIAEEDIDLFDEFSKLLIEGIKEARADTIDEFVKMVKEKMREVATGKRTSLIGTGWIDEIARELKGE